MLASLGVTGVLSALKYFIVVGNVSIATFCLFLNNNGGFWITVVDPAATSSVLALGRVLRDETGMDSVVVAKVSLSVEEQVGRFLGGSVAEKPLAFL